VCSNQGALEKQYKFKPKFPEEWGLEPGIEWLGARGM